jgi:hypothetical protein
MSCRRYKEKEHPYFDSSSDEETANCTCDIMRDIKNRERKLRYGEDGKLDRGCSCIRRKESFEYRVRRMKEKKSWSYY